MANNIRRRGGGGADAYVTGRASVWGCARKEGDLTGKTRIPSRPCLLLFSREVRPARDKRSGEKEGGDVPPSIHKVPLYAYITFYRTHHAFNKGAESPSFGASL